MEIRRRIIHCGCYVTSMEMAATAKIFLLAGSLLFLLLNVGADERSRTRDLHDGAEGKKSSNVNNSSDICDCANANSSDGEIRKRSLPRLFNDSTPTDASLTTTGETDYSYLSEKFMSCLHICIEPNCYEKLQNGSVFVPGYKLVFERPDYLINEENILFLCPDFFNPIDGGGEKDDNPVAMISLIGSTISAFCLLLHLIVYFAVKTAKNLPSRCIMSLCIALLFAYLSTFVQLAAKDDMSCRVVGMCMVYFFLASFFWMNVFSYDVWRSVWLATTKLRMTHDRPVMVRFARYSIYAWGSPLLIVIFSIIVHFSTSNIKYHLIFDEDICWFLHKEALTLYFAGPLFTLLGLNTVLTVSSFVMISAASMKEKSGNSISADRFDLKARIFLSLKLCSSMGLTWIFGVVALITKQDWLRYLFVICSALQGVFIFFSFTVSERSRKELMKIFQNRKSSAMPTQTSSQRTTAL